MTHAARRGLTLLEILAAIAMLAMLATVATPLYRDALRATRAPAERVIDPTELIALADRYLDDPASFEVPAEPEAADGSVELLWPDEPERTPVRVQRLAPGGGPATDEVDRIWFCFTSGDQVVHRCVLVDVAQPESAPEEEEAPG